MLSTNELALLRRMEEATMPETVVIHRKTMVDNGHGGFTESDTTVATVTGRVNLPGQSPQEKLIAAQLAGTQTYTISLPYGTDATTGDELVVTTKNNQVFTVIAPLLRSFEVARRVVCKEKS